MLQAVLACQLVVHGLELGLDLFTVLLCGHTWFRNQANSQPDGIGCLVFLSELTLKHTLPAVGRVHYLWRLRGMRAQKCCKFELRVSSD